MTKIEFDKIDSTWYLIDEKLKKVCFDNEIDYYDYTGCFIRLLEKNNMLFNRLNMIKKIDFSNKLDVRAILNKAHFSTKENEIIEAEKRYKEYQIKLFKWLDKTQTPYFFILNPYFKYGYFTDGYKYLKNFNTGIKNLYIAVEYANYKMNY